MTGYVEATVSRLVTLYEAAGPRLGWTLVEANPCDVVGLATLLGHASLDTTRL